MKGSKRRIESLRGEMACAAGAELALTLRLKDVERLLGAASTGAHEDVEHVHQLRVATRRAGAALRAFGPCLGERERKRVRKGLKRIRRAAGRARDCDVHIEALGGLLARVSDKEHDAAQRALHKTVAERGDAQQAIGDAAARYSGGRLRRERRALTASATSCATGESAGGGARSVRDLAETVVPPRLSALRERVASMSGAVEELHAVRIEAKRLRYVCEIFEDCVDAQRWAAFYAAIRALLDDLGAMNDADQLLARVRRTGGQDEGADAGLDTLLKRLEGEFEDKRLAAEGAVRRFMEGEGKTLTLFDQRGDEGGAEGGGDRGGEGGDPARAA